MNEIKPTIRIASTFAAAAGLVWACSSSNPASGFGERPDAGTVNDDDGAVLPDFGDAGGGPPGKLVTISGKTFAPNGTLLLANTLVYVTDAEPAPIPDGTYCDKCIEIPENTFIFSKADGSFEISTKLTVGKHKLVVQKGQFRRIREFTVSDTDTAIKIPNVDSTLPGKNDVPKGDTIPKMLVLTGTSESDHIEASLRKLGVTELKVQASRAIAADAAELKKYNVVFMPCATSTDRSDVTPEMRRATVDFVNSGGKLYVTDWSYEWVKQPFGDYVKWEGTATNPGGLTTGEYDGAGSAEDPGLKDWLAAIGEGSLQLKGNWTKIKGLTPLPGPDENGVQGLITPKVWMDVTDETGKKRHATVSFQQACGRVLFSTYHTEGDLGGGSDLIGQEKALLYILLEVSACAGQVRPPS
jgi:intracellular sulfur oxidation DsrE/DsrF family protein